ncbi:MAG: hypothetical protein QOJ45_421 [Verrucomicrobiota bacterium]|jgi:hypothetical protein
MNTFEKYFEDFPEFLETILAWSPHYIVPVAKKACKLLKTLPDAQAFRENPDLIKYRNFFKLSNVSVRNRRIAIVDDATQHTSTLQEYRRYFENLGATVRTFSFVGHEAVVQGSRWKEDPLAEICKSLPEPVYQEYILQQSYHLLKSGNHFDLDHLVFETPITASQFERFLQAIKPLGLLLFVEDYFLKSATQRFSLDDVSFFDTVPYLDHESIELGSVRKIKFSYDPDKGKLFFSPLVFPTWNFHLCDVGAALFHDIPYTLPYQCPDSIDKTNQGSLLRIYYNIYFAAAVSLAKAFVQQDGVRQQLTGGVKLRHNDLDALLGVANTAKLLTGTREFLESPDWPEFHSERGVQKVRRSRNGRYSDFGEVVDDLKRGYEKKLAKKTSRVGLHYYLPYKRLFRQFPDKAALSAGLDYYCDFGIVVPETIIDSAGGRILRACRAGEPSSDYSWRRTQVLIPVAIEQFATATGKTNTVEATALMKLLANFTFDYPSDMFHELHCLIGEPYMYGTFVRAYHPQRAARKPSVYEAARISDFYQWNKSERTFSVKRNKRLVSQAQEVFDERQEIPYSEIVTYFRFLAKVYNLFKKRLLLNRPVDALNMLAICREENYFYSHVLFNINMAIEDLSLSLDGNEGAENAKYLQEAREQAKSAEDKIGFADSIEEAVKVINAHFGSDLQFAGILRRFGKNRRPFTDAFKSTLEALRAIVAMEVVLAAILSARTLETTSYLVPLRDARFKVVLKKFGIASDEELNSLVHDSESCAKVSLALYQQIRDGVAALPREEPLLMTRLNMEALERAKNIATHYVYRNQLSRLTLLYIDFSGLRTIPEPKEDVVSRYYRVVIQNARRRGGEILYGGRGGDDAFTIAFRDVGPSLQCAKDIKKDFADDLFLSSGRRDVKFGLSFVVFEGLEKEEQIIQCWGDSKDCCEFKGPTFRNHGNLLISDKTFRALNTVHGATYSTVFKPLVAESFKNIVPVHSYREIEPLTRV